MNIQTVQFHDQIIQVINHEGKPYVAMRSLCENIGLTWSSQLERIRRNEILDASVLMIRTEQVSGVLRELLCLPLGYLNGWLLGIDTKRVKPEIRGILHLYKLECYDVLYNHFLPEVAAVHPNTIDIEQQHEIKSLVNEVSRKTGIHYQGVYTRLYEKFKIPRYQELPLRDYQGAIEFLSSLVAPDEELERKRQEQIFIVGIMKAGLEKNSEVTRAYRELFNELMNLVDDTDVIKKKIYEIGRKIRHISVSDGVIYDAMAEPYTRLKVDKSVYEEGEKLAKKLSKPLNLEDWS